jgi:hypothetical protein
MHGIGFESLIFGGQWWRSAWSYGIFVTAVVNIYHRYGKYLPPLWQIPTTAVINIYHRGGKSGEKEIQFKRMMPQKMP